MFSILIKYLVEHTYLPIVIKELAKDWAKAHAPASLWIHGGLLEQLFSIESDIWSETIISQIFRDAGIRN